ncbi:alpha/beta hydrolase [Mesobacterium sp. TK19101]|uniref:Alpha/beta hydrolase n=1 Tax=Mesobacterium hydrothermale TaxID=3111907 RepID=A0ABU6HJF0_9RHOB|nr:alpha/beta hydrolase [Mesobacterium sp. TK19101]MEC3861999.1 alpha/beta hydrolase [Mesobacterium sp. TK19101]
MSDTPIFDGELLRATLTDPGAGQLFVSFRQRIGQPGGFEHKAPIQFFLRRGFAHLHIQSRWNDWFINAETEALEAALAELAARYDRRVAMGFSMGGYGVLRFARALSLNAALAISPQYSIAKQHVRFDRRYHKESRGWDAELGDLSARGSELAGAILFDPFKRNDLFNALLIAGVFPHMRLARLGCGGHPASRPLMQAGDFNWLRGRLLSGTPDSAAIVRRHRKARKNSESYWRHLAELARRHGRKSLADRVLLQAAQLSQGTDDSGS